MNSLLQTVSGSNTFSIRDFGATGDGKAKDTEAVQQAIDACTAAGGGRVYCPPGTYLLGTMTLKDNVELYLEAGCTLLASPELTDYEPNYLIYAKDARQIAIRGRGTIDGNGRSFLSPPSLPSPRAWMPRGPIPKHRPRAVVHFIDCVHVWITDVLFVDAMFFTVWPLGCDHVRIQGITIRSNRLSWNADGVDPDCCRDVRISDCYIEAGDDAIAVKSDSHRLGRQKACEQIVVTNCTLISPMCGIRIGYEGDSPIRDCTFSNLNIINSRRGICVQVATHRPFPGMASAFEGILIEHGPAIENISFSNINLDTMKAFFFWVDHEASAPGCIRNVSFSNISGSTERSSYICGSPTIPLEELRFSNVQLTVNGETDDQYARVVPDPYGHDQGRWGNWGTKGIPCAFYFRYVRDLDLHDVRVKWGRLAGPWMEAIRMENVTRCDLSGLVARQAQSCPDAAAVRMNHVRDVLVRGCRAEAGTGTFLSVEGADSAGITLVGNDFQRAARACHFHPEVPQTTVAFGDRIG